MTAMKEAKPTLSCFGPIFLNRRRSLKRGQDGLDVSLISNNTTGSALFALVGDLAEGYMLVTPMPCAHRCSGDEDGQRPEQEYGNPEKTLANLGTRLSVSCSLGYITAMVEGLRKAGPDLNPETLVKGLENKVT